MIPLRPGTALFAMPDGGTALRAADGELFDLALSPEDAARVRDQLAAGEEVEAFRSAGHLAPRAVWPDDRRDVGVLCADPKPLVDSLYTCGVRAVVLESTVGVAEIVGRGLAAVCALYTGPAPEWWAGLDELPDHGIAWQRVSCEGRHVLLEPVAAQPGDVTHTDVRLRRLAAAGSGHRHLSAYWSADLLVGDEAPTRSEWTLIAALTVQDLALWAYDLPAPRRRLRVVDLATGDITDHPVLPVPPVAP